MSFDGNTGKLRKLGNPQALDFHDDTIDDVLKSLQPIA
jgi:hypothetical protein